MSIRPVCFFIDVNNENVVLPRSAPPRPNRSRHEKVGAVHALVGVFRTVHSKCQWDEMCVSNAVPLLYIVHSQATTTL